MQESVQFSSQGLTICGVLETPRDYKPGEKRPAIMVLHGFGSNKDSGSCTMSTRLFESLGYITLRFDFRGCGQS
jgi:dipeptidyl aminopeptidase/acylaminoacyl peptidase